MTLPVVYRPRAQSDLTAEYDWYEQQRAGLGEDFLAAIQATSKRIGEYPEIFRAAHGEIRRAIVPRFPFAMFYLLELNRAVVLRVLHTARDPKLWPRLTRNLP